MKRLITFEPHHSETYTPTEVFVNLYLEGQVTGTTSYTSLEFARTARLSYVGGVTLRIARDVAGDFTVTKEEEF